MMYYIIESFLDDVQKDKVKVVDKKNLKSLLEFYHPEQLEIKFGG